MRRRLFTILSALSLLLCIGVIALWVQTSLFHRIPPLRRIHAANGGDWLFLSSWGSSSGGELGCQWLPLHGPNIRGPNWKDNPAIAIWKGQFPRPVRFDWHGVKFGHGPAYGTDSQGVVWMEGDGGYITIPDWFAALALGLLPCRWYVLKRRCWQAERFARQGCCTQCGYDLRASPERCPECGTPVPADLVRKPVA